MLTILLLFSIAKMTLSLDSCFLSKEVATKMMIYIRNQNTNDNQGSNWRGERQERIAEIIIVNEYRLLSKECSQQRVFVHFGFLVSMHTAGSGTTGKLTSASYIGDLQNRKAHRHQTFILHHALPTSCIFTAAFNQPQARVESFPWKVLRLYLSSWQEQNALQSVK